MRTPTYLSMLIASHIMITVVSGVDPRSRCGTLGGSVDSIDLDPRVGLMEDVPSLMMDVGKTLLHDDDW